MLTCTYFKLSESKAVSIIIIVQVNRAVFFVAWFHTLGNRGENKLSRAVKLAPTRLGMYQSLNYFDYFTYFKLFECRDVSLIIIIQVKLSWAWTKDKLRHI